MKYLVRRASDFRVGDTLFLNYSEDVPIIRISNHSTQVCITYRKNGEELTFCKHEDTELLTREESEKGRVA